MKTKEESRREFVKKLAYVTPSILTLPATPAKATPGSCKSIGGPRYPCIELDKEIGNE